MFVSFARKKETNKHNLIKLRTDNARKKLRRAVEKSQNDIFLVRLSTAINPYDAHATDVRYYNTCYVKHVTNVLRTETLDRSKASSIESEMAAEIEFIGEVKTSEQRQDFKFEGFGNQVQEIRESNGVDQLDISKKKKQQQMKQILTENVDDVQFSKPVGLNESEKATLKKTSDKTIQALEETHIETDMQNIFTVGKTLRKQMLNVEPWKFSGSVDNDEIGEHLPNTLVIFFRWLIQGPSKLNEKC